MDKTSAPQTEHTDPLGATPLSAPEVYEAPRVELVLDTDTLTREVQYAGISIDEGPG